MFMNQILAYELDQISAFGFFDINLNLVTSVSTGIDLINSSNYSCIFILIHRYVAYQNTS